MKEESLLLLSDLQKLINQVVLIDYTIIILGGRWMDLIKIGKYIAGKRKSLGMTQKQLAEKLGMSDKSVSKWERGVCLPDVSVYKELCSILGISLNEFLAGEDIAQENMIQKSETNIIEVIRDNIDKQKCLKVMKCILLVISICAVSVIGFTIYRLKKPQNYISPVAKDSIEMQTAELLAGPDGAFVYKFITTDEYKNSDYIFIDTNQEN